MLLCCLQVKVTSPQLPPAPAASSTFLRNQSLMAERSVSCKLQEVTFLSVAKKRGCKIRGQAQLLGLHAAGPHRKGMSSSHQGTVWPPSLVNCVLNQMRFYNSA